MNSRDPKSRPIAIHMKPIAAAVATAVGTFTGGTASAANTFLEEIVVTATRRATDTQDIPYNISAFSGEVLEQHQIHDLNQFARWVPGLTVADQGLRSANTLTVRGLNATSVDASELITNASGGGGTVATYLGEVPLYIDLRLVDIERVEVLIGPQGTLYGEGTLGGAVRFLPIKPRADETTVDLRVKAYDMSESDDAGFAGDLIFNIPIVRDVFAFRGNVGISEVPGFIDYNNLVRNPGVSNPEPDLTNPAAVAANLVSEKDADGGTIVSARAALLWNIADSGELLVSYNYQDMDIDGKTANSAASFGTGNYVSGYRFPEPKSRENQLVSATLIWDFDFAELTSTVAYSKYDELGQRDQTDLLLNIGYTYPDFPQFAAFTEDVAEQEISTFETRLVSNSDSSWNWIAGVFYRDNEYSEINKEFTPGFPEFLGIAPLPTGDLEYFNTVNETFEEIAVFGEIGYQITDRWQVTGGARWFDYDDEITQKTDFPLVDFFGTPETFNTGDDDIIFKFNTSLDIDGWIPGMSGGQTYLTISEGYRNGGHNAIQPCVGAGNQQNVCVFPSEATFNTDTTLNYEVGLKADWLDSGLQTDIALFLVEWNDVQIDSITVIGNAPITSNSSDAQSVGLEFSGRFQINDRWSMYGAYAYTDVELTKDAPNSIGVRTPPTVFPPNLPVDAFDGDRLPGTPKQQGAFNINYTQDIFRDMTLSVDYGFTSTSSIYTKTGLRGGGESLGGFTLHNASVTFASDAWSAMLYTKNMFDKFAQTGVRRDTDFLDKRTDGDGIYVAPGNAFTLRQYHHNVIQPRTIGVDFRYSFNFNE